MKTLLFLVTLLTLSCSFAKEQSFSSAGVGNNGKTFAGTLSSKDNGATFNGELVDENGGSHDFKGKRDEHGNIIGKTKDGIQVELSTE